MKRIKKSISLPEDLFKWLEKQAAKHAKERGVAHNVSGVISEVLQEEKNRLELKKAA